jgi:uncharacterized membrane protein
MTYDLLLLAHILAALAWLGAGFTFLVLLSMAARRGDDTTTVKLLGYSTDLGLRLFVPASLATFVFGALLVADGPWTADQLWIGIALAGYAVTFLTGVLVAKPRGERLDALIAQNGGVLGPEAREEVGRLLLIGRLDYAVLLAVVADMALKPTADDGGALAVIAAIVVGGLLLVGSRARRLAAAPA